ncbi:unnamed protein product [Prorocentrum cordatum]|uniref:Uncharacterized protein n=1 Tax=Prorocentrum cordatum TaxID=2364126 RepID=A0ABN9QS91_9DINO|nr:unnamed protein product [Polarella glacialis]
MSWWVYTSDGGPDQRVFKRFMCVDAAPNQFIVAVGIPCLMHIGQLTTQTGLHLVDAWMRKLGVPWKYFSSCAKITHCWRDAAAKVLGTWTSLFGAADACEHALKLPPKCVAGRWLSVSATESRLRSASGGAGCDGHLVTALRAALALTDADVKAIADADRDGPGDVALGVIDEARLEQQVAYRQKLGRWRRDALSTVSDPVFWFVVDVMCIVHAPGTHFQLFLQRKPDDVFVSGNHMAQLVEGGLVDFNDEYTDVVLTYDWPGSYKKVQDDPRIDNGMCYNLMLFALEEFLHHAASFHRRVFREFNRFSDSEAVTLAAGSHINLASAVCGDNSQPPEACVLVLPQSAFPTCYWMKMFLLWLECELYRLTFNEGANQQLEFIAHDWTPPAAAAHAGKSRGAHDDAKRGRAC